MKSIIAEEKRTSVQAQESVPCYYMPKTFLTDRSLSEYSLDCKLLTGVVISLAHSSKEIMDTASLIQKLGDKAINQMLNELRLERGE